MKRIRIGIIFFAIASISYSQAPQAFNYQAILRNIDGTVKANESAVLQISVIHGHTDGPPVYTEIHNSITSAVGMVNLVIGEGETSDDLSLIDWANGPYFLEISVDGVAMGLSPMLSVPYALYAASGNEGQQGPPGPQGEQGLQGQPGDTRWVENDSSIYYVAGNVGIGTANPQSNLHLHGSPLLSDMRGQLSLSSPLGNDVWLSLYEDNQYKAYLWWDANDGALRLQNRNMGNISLNSAGGNVGIGTKEPIETLHVNGNAQIDGNLIVHGDVTMKDLLAEMQMLKDMAGIGSVADIDGNIYKTVKIGNQVWIAENLKVTHYNDGTPIGVMDTFYSVGALMWYDFDINNKDIYGGIYATVNNVCPAGWHVSTRAEWEILEDYLDGGTASKLKEKGTEHWPAPNKWATNETGFTALPSGHFRIEYHSGYSQSFMGLGEETRIWSPDLNPDQDPESYGDLSDFTWILFDDQTIIFDPNSSSNDITIFGSIRCVMD